MVRQHCPHCGKFLAWAGREANALDYVDANGKNQFVGALPGHIWSCHEHGAMVCVESSELDGLDGAKEEDRDNAQT